MIQCSTAVAQRFQIELFGNQSHDQIIDFITDVSPIEPHVSRIQESCSSILTKDMCINPIDSNKLQKASVSTPRDGYYFTSSLIVMSS